MAYEPATAANESEHTPETLFLEHQMWLRAVLRRRYGPDAADDLVQETYLRLAPYQPSRPIVRPRALLLRIAVNLAHDQHRRAARAALIPAPVEYQASVAAPQASALVLKQVILGLPPKLRDVFILNQVRGLSHKETAELLGISPKTVEWRLRKALAVCAAAMRE
ncbi:RNA polymerase sigma factor [Caulobacter sp. 73W]|uniref:RNA polymerase sigma factor n=1 Tax=Caulobacter sp. 73W TaxID=3161137 RepID=A0AB39KSA1_9CAUL